MSKKKITQKITAKQLRKIEEDNALRLILEKGPDELIKKKGSDKLLDLKLERIELMGGNVIDVKALHKFITETIQEYRLTFPQDFYKSTFILKGWKIPANGKIYRKPGLMRKYTAQIIYGRFPKEILPALQGKNKYFPEIGGRLYKHFQFLTPEKYDNLKIHIKDAYELMQKCKSWPEFEREHAKKFGEPFQLSLFETT